jgi:hypothetical protein
MGLLVRCSPRPPRACCSTTRWMIFRGQTCPTRTACIPLVRGWVITMGRRHHEHDHSMQHCGLSTCRAPPPITTRRGQLHCAPEAAVVLHGAHHCDAGRAAAHGGGRQWRAAHPVRHAADAREVGGRHGPLVCGLPASCVLSTFPPRTRTPPNTHAGYCSWAGTRKMRCRCRVYITSCCHTPSCEWRWCTRMMML